MAYAFGKRSRTAMIGLDPRLIQVLDLAITISPVDFMVIEGVRTRARQKELYAQGRTKPGKVVTWTLNSNHFVNLATGFGEAFDALPAPYDWSTKGPNGDPFVLMADAIFEAGRRLRIPIRWGADWDQDGNPKERGETDSPHFELGKKFSQQQEG